MEFGREDNPWKHKSRIELIASLDITIAIFGIVCFTHRMFTFYWNINEQKVSDVLRDESRIPFFLFVWVVIMLFYLFHFAATFVLLKAITEDAIESDPYLSVQKCYCWLRGSRVILTFIVIKLCLQPVIILVGKFTNVYTIVFGFVELMFRSASIFGVKSFIQDLQQ